MQRLFHLILLLVSASLVVFSFSAYRTLTQFQSLVNQVNEFSPDPSIPENTSIHSDVLADFENLHARMPWDADLTSMLIIVTNNLVNQTVHKGRQQILVSRIQEYYQQSLSYRPRDVQVLSGQLELLIDQGAPASYVLPKLDFAISMVPNDQGLKAELSLICFKLLALNPQPQERTLIIERLQRLFDNPMDYRGLIIVKRYAKLYGQEEPLKTILAQQN